MVGDTLLIYNALCGEPVATNSAAFAVRNQHCVIGFDDTTSESIVFSAVMPENYGGGNLTVWIEWTAGSAAAFTDAGDTGNYLTFTSLTGYSPSNSTNMVWYWNLVVSGTNYTINIYSDLAKTLLVASGTRTGTGVLALTAQNGSGLSGSVTIAGTPVSEVAAGQTLSVNRVEWGITFEREQQNVFSLGTDAWGTQAVIYDGAPSAAGIIRYVSLQMLNTGSGGLTVGITAGDVFRMRIVRVTGVTPNIVGDCQIKTIEIRES